MYLAKINKHTSTTIPKVRCERRSSGSLKSLNPEWMVSSYREIKEKENL